MNFLDYWKVESTLSFTRGKRDDINDDLYRIAPLNGLISLTHQREKWFASIEALFYARQSKVSRTNNESKSSGYGLLNLRGQVDLTEYFSISAGIENVLDKKYTDHLAGTNRVANSDVPVGEKLPGYGRSAYISATGQMVVIYKPTQLKFCLVFCIA